MKYYYVVLGSEWDLYKISYSDINVSQNGMYVAGLSSILGNKTTKYLNSVLIRITGIPIARYILKPLLRKLKSIEFPICFILFGNWVEYEVSIKFLDYLKNLFPDSRYVWFMQDLVDTHPRIKSRINQLIQKFNLVLSFDYSDSKNYDLVYHPLVFSSVENFHNEFPDSDIYFLGKAKNRLPEIIRTYEYLKNKGLKLDFYIVGVPEGQHVYPKEIHYIEGMSYIDNLKHIKRCKCALEIMQKGGSGYTQRVCEVLYFNKKIITNNKYLKEAPFYDESNMYVVDESFNIDDTFISKIKDSQLIDYKYKEQLSPLRLLEYIDSKLV